MGRGLVPPNDFFPICDETGLMVPLGRRLMGEACAQVQRWREWFGIDLRLSVNLPVAELDQPDLIDAVTAALADAGAEPSTLCLEIRARADDRGLALPGEPRSCGCAIIEAVIGLARALGLRAVAEGVETGAQCSEPQSARLRVPQGFFFGRPLPAAELGQLLG